MGYRPELGIRTGSRAWDTIWKWFWFTRDQWQPEFRKWKEGTRQAMRSLLPRLKVKSILDCSCGLGWKSIILAEMGYEVEGCDASTVAVRRAADLVNQEGLDCGCSNPGGRVWLKPRAGNTTACTTTPLRGSLPADLLLRQREALLPS